MGITTKKGDKGMTALYLGGRVPKDDIRVEIYGSLDELCSFLGMAKSLVPDKKMKRLIESVQGDLFVIGAEVAARPASAGKLKKRISIQDAARLEVVLKGLEKKKTFEECCFYLPGAGLASSVLDVSRTVCRRLERRVVSFKRKGGLKNPEVLVYLNRLSDLLYLLARSMEGKHERVMSA